MDLYELKFFVRFALVAKIIFFGKNFIGDKDVAITRVPDSRTSTAKLFTAVIYCYFRFGNIS
jgi:hypothetical protein